MNENAKKILPSSSSRILEIDLIRGFVLISMAIDHGTSLTRVMGRNAPSPITMAQVLPSTTAEIFFLLSGYLLGHVRLAKSTMLERRFVEQSLERAWSLYCFNGITMLAVASCMTLASPELLGASRFDTFVSDPFTAIREFVLLQSAPFGFDVLQLYVMFFLATPIFAFIFLKNKTLAVALLVFSWSATQAWTVTIGLEHDETIAINFWAWLITFFGGMALGAGRRYEAISNAIIRNPVYVRVAIGLLVVFAVAWLGQRYPHRLGLDEQPWTVPGVDRASLGPLKILCSLSVLVVLIWIADRYDLVRTAIGRGVTMLGQNSLASFCASNVGIYAVALAWQASGSNLVFWLTEFLLVAFIFAWVGIMRMTMKRPDTEKSTTTSSGTSASGTEERAAAFSWLRQKVAAARPRPAGRNNATAHPG